MRLSGIREAQPGQTTYFAYGRRRHYRAGAVNNSTHGVGPGGLERIAADYASLFAAAGFRLTRTVATTTDWVVIEAVPAEEPDANYRSALR
jgi:hypothetical protein